MEPNEIGVSSQDACRRLFLSFAGMATVATLAGRAAGVLIGRGHSPVTVRKWSTRGSTIACTEPIGARASS